MSTTARTKPGPATAAQGTLTKSVFALAIEPISMALSVTGRKAYDVMLWLAQRSQPAPDGGYSSPVSAILRGYGSTTKASERVQRYIEQMVQTAVVWRPLAASERGTLVLEGFEPSRDQGVTDEARTFPLLAEARLYMKGGEAWVTWYYPPSIKEQLVNPERWAQIELNSIARLTTYTAVALYEICARYKDSPGGLTSRHEPDFWTRVLREGGGVKPREFRKFKNELLVPAMSEINDVTEIEVELLEHREHGVLKEVQFKVRRRAKETQHKPEPADVTLALRGAKVGIREADLDALVSRYGAFKVTDALDVMDAYLNDPKAERIKNPAAYLRAVLANRFPGSSDAQGQADGSQSHASDGLSRQEKQLAREVGAAECVVRGASSADEREWIAQEWRASRLRQVRDEFASLSSAERSVWLERAALQLKDSATFTPAMKRRLDVGDWQSPLISRVVLDLFARNRHGPDWREPSEMDLVMFSVATDR